MESLRFSWELFFTDFLKIAIAFVLTLPIAWERERSERSAGLRTFPLVAVASCGYVLIALASIGAHASDQSRIIQGLMSGIGFIGGGAILKGSGTVRGTATAASIWTTGALGASVAYAHYEIAVLMSAMNYLTLRVLTPIERKINPADQPEEDQE
ncbi:MgtC/SapB family protein [Myxacorys almedinensis]|uniref:MgtC/SapB family protein n=1 Tax=Myxacorys almedinensis A TaxID=2690445 RepID=A0A8J8CKT0_9CYAN|nr:MgtC/SapB family protein [Myxacorys almedinensis]NDJ19849.1 MgtC/SapB family protein [Myxacorys almedinensis A]